MSLRDDLFSNNKKEDYFSSVKANEVNVPLATPPVYGVTAPKATPVPTSFPVQPEQTIAERNRNGENIFSILQSYNKPYDFEAEMKQAERARKGALFTDVAGLAGDALTSLMGRRQFAKTVPNTAIANARIEKLKDLKRRYDVDYNNKRLDAAYRQFMLDRDDKRYNDSRTREERRYNDSRQREDKRYEESMNWRENEADYRKQRDAVRDEQWQEEKKRQNRMLGIQEERAASQERYNKLRGDAARLSALAKIEKSKAKSPKDYDYFYGANGRKTRISKSLQNNAAAYLVGRMKEIVSSKENKTVDDRKFLGEIESGRKTDIVNTYLKIFPELQDELEIILNEAEPAASSAPKKSLGFEVASEAQSQKKSLGFK